MNAIISKFANPKIAILACFFLFFIVQTVRLQSCQAKVQQTQAALDSKTTEAKRLQSELASERARMTALQNQSATMKEQLQTAQSRWNDTQKNLNEVLKNDQAAKNWGNQSVPAGIDRMLNQPKTKH